MKRFLYFLSWGGMAFYCLACSDEAPQSDPCETNPPVINNIAVSNANCNAATGSLIVEAGGGNGTLSYSLNGSDFQADNSFTQLAGASYTISVRDEENCQVQQEAVVEVASSMSLDIASMTGSGCGSADGMVKLDARGGQSPYTYSLDGSTFQEEDEFDNLNAGPHTVYIKDATGCELQEEVEIKTGISFEASVQTIIESNCAVSGCHVSGTNRANFNEFSEVKKNASSIMRYTQEGSMPPEKSGKTLTDSEIAAIACWVEDGAPQN
jgi:hypothetical protein